MSTQRPQATDLVEHGDLAADIGGWPEWVVEAVEEETVVRAREQCRAGSAAQAAVDDLLARVRRGEER